MEITDLLSFKVFIEDAIKSSKYSIDLSIYNKDAPSKEKIRRGVGKSMKPSLTLLSTNINEKRPEKIKQIPLTDDEVAFQLRLEIKKFLETNLIVTG